MKGRTWGGSGRRVKRHAVRPPWLGAVPSHDAGKPGQCCPHAGWHGPRCHRAPQSPPEPGWLLPTTCGGEGSGVAPHCRGMGTCWNLPGPLTAGASSSATPRTVPHPCTPTMAVEIPIVVLLSWRRFSCSLAPSTCSTAALSQAAERCPCRKDFNEIQYFLVIKPQKLPP